MNNYPWAINHSKLSAAVLHLKAYGIEINQDSVKAEYVRRGGLVKEVLDDSPVAPVETAEPAEPVSTPEVSSEESKPVRRGRRVSK